MKKAMSVLLVAALVLGLAGGLVGASAADYPRKPITIVVPYSPGGASDTVSRIYAKELEKILNNPVIVTNRTGASGAVGLEFVKSSAPDGYTLAYMPVESTMISALGFTDTKSSDFTFIGRAMTIPASVTVRADSEWKTLDEFLEYAKQNPEKLRAGNSGTGSIWHIAAALLERERGSKFIHVPFEGAAPAIAALMGKNIELVTVSPSEIQSAVESGEFRVLAVLGEKRSSILPEIPTAKELGVDVVIQGWGAFAVPKGTPAEIVAILEKASEQALNSEEMKSLLAKRGFEHAYMNAADMDAFAQKNLEMFSDLIPSLGISK